MATNVNVLDRAPQMLWRVANVVAPLFEDPKGLDRPLCRSYSKYDGTHVSLDVAALNGVLLMAQRSTLGWSGIDPTFGDRYIQAGDIGMFRTSYHIHYPSLNPLRQFDNWISIHPERDIIPRVLDAELQDGQTDAKVGESIWDMMELCYAYDGVWPLVYSRYMLLDKWLKYWDQEQLDKLQLWGARYLWDRTREHPGPPYVIKRMPNIGTKLKPEQWLLHQTADKKAPFDGETTRESIVCWERWEHGNKQNMFQYISANWGGETSGSSADLEARVAQNEDDIYTILSWVTDHEEVHEAEPVEPDPEPEPEPEPEPDPDPDPPPAPEMAKVHVKENFSLHVVTGYNVSGKPKMAPPKEDDPIRVRVKAGDVLDIRAKAWHSEGDDPNSPVIIADGGTKYYEHYWCGQFIRKDKVEKLFP